MSRLTERFPPNQTERSGWQISPEVGVVIGQVLDDSFGSAHRSETVYEHERHTSDELRYHPILSNMLGSTRPEGDISGAAREELEVLAVLVTDEQSRILRIVGDVGVGKSTFIRHLIEEHFPTVEFGSPIPIYLDWRTFTASATDPLPEIRRRFYDDVFDTLEKKIDPDEIRATDYRALDESRFTSTHRTRLRLTEPENRDAERNRLLREIAERQPLDLAYARLNLLSENNRNRFVIIIIIDNVDQLPPMILESLVRFVAEVRQSIKSLVIVATRDHTLANRSVYDFDAVLPGWNTRLYPPSITRVLARRLAHFFPKNLGLARFGKSLVVREPEMIAQVCHALLQSPFTTVKGRAFLSSWSNYGIRELFRLLQRLLTFHGIESRGHQVLATKAPFEIGVDDIVVALALNRHLMFYSSKSQVFNMYSAGDDLQPRDRVVGARLVQYLRPYVHPHRYRDIRAQFVSWGYNAVALDRQALAMLHKDVLWSDCGDPTHFSADSSFVRLSYRGELYADMLVRRATYNYLMSFDVVVPPASSEDIALPLLRRAYQSEVRPELEAFADLDRPLDLDRFGMRVVALAELLCRTEAQEFRVLSEAGLLADVRAQCRLTSCADAAISGLERFMVAAADKQGSRTRQVGYPSKDLRESVEAVKAAIGTSVTPFLAG